MDTALLLTASTWVLPVVFAITLHEAAHGFVAERFGDDTARLSGRVTFNPLRHIDPVGTVLLPALLLLARSPVMFGYAKPVPVDFSRLRPLRLGMVMVAVAGPATNMLLAIASALLLHLATLEDWLALNLVHSIIINCALALFNMIPILPLDGGRVLRALLPGSLGDAYARTERYGLFLVIGLLMVPAWLGLTILMDVFGMGVTVLAAIVLYIAGNPAIGTF